MLYVGSKYATPRSDEHLIIPHCVFLLVLYLPTRLICLRSAKREILRQCMVMVNESPVSGNQQTENGALSGEGEQRKTKADRIIIIENDSILGPLIQAADTIDKRLGILLITISLVAFFFDLLLWELLSPYYYSILDFFDTDKTYGVILYLCLALFCVGFSLYKGWAMRVYQWIKTGNNAP